jgi:hypothetical protein
MARPNETPKIVRNLQSSIAAATAVKINQAKPKR